MNWIRHNLTYIGLAFIAIVLIFFTIQLQSLLLDLPAANQPMEREQLATATPPPAPLLVLPTVLPALPTPTPLTPITTGAVDSSPSTVVTNLGQNQGVVDQVESFSPEERLEIEMLGATNLTTSEEDAILVELIKSNARAVGFIRYSSYVANQDTLRAVKIQTNPSGGAIEANEDTVASGAYPFSRPLLLYTSVTDLKAKPQLEGYVGCYLNHLLSEIEDVGYTPPSLAMYRDALDTFKATCRRCQMTGSSNPLFPQVPACSAEGIGPAPLDITGGSTVYPLSARIGDLYKEAGFAGALTIEDIGTGSGFERFCEKGEADLVNASRLAKDKEQSLCQAKSRDLIAFPVGLDLVVVVVSRQNSFVEQLTFDQLRLLFTKALRWSEINTAWPAESIIRAIPNKSRGTFAFFVEMLYAGSSSTPAAVAQAPSTASLPATQSPSVAVVQLPTPTGPPAPPTATEINRPTQRVDFRIGYVDRGDDCRIATEIMQAILETELGYHVEPVAFRSPEDLFAAFSASQLQNRVDWTMCYVEPTDHSQFEKNSVVLSVIGDSYRQWDGKSYAIVSGRAMQRVLQQELSCVYSLLKNFKLTDESLREQPAAAWVTDHQDLVQTWTNCR